MHYYNQYMLNTNHSTEDDVDAATSTMHFRQIQLIDYAMYVKTAQTRFSAAAKACDLTN